MKIYLILILFLFSLSSDLSAQIKINPPFIINFSSRCFFYPAAHLNGTLLQLNKPTSLKYQPTKLPFFCGMEEKCRNKFNVFVKLRAGNDESYMKMIRGSTGKLYNP